MASTGRPISHLPDEHRWWRCSCRLPIWRCPDWRRLLADLRLAGQLDRRVEARR